MYLKNMMNKILQVKPEKIFLLIALIYGLSFLVINPPFQVYDEREHFYRSFTISDGQLMPSNFEGRSGIIISDNVQEMANHFVWLSRHPESRLSVEDIKNNMSITFKGERSFAIIGSAVATYSPLPYLASSFGMFVGKCFSSSVLVLLYLGRFMNLILWCFLIYLSIKITPVNKWVFLLLALMPMTVYQAASLSADSLTIGLCFLIISIFFRFSLDSASEINNKIIFTIFLLSLFISLSKPIYMLIIFLFFMIPVNKFKSWKQKFSVFVVISSPIFIMVLAWNLLFKGMIMPPLGVSTSAQISYILSNPLSLFAVFGNTLFNSSVDIISMFVGQVAFLNGILPSWLIYGYLLILILVALLENKEVEIRLNQKIVPLFVFLSSSLLIFIVEYITFTPVGQNFIEGIHGRYFIPVAPLLFILFYNKRFNTEFKYLNLIIIIFTVISLFIALFVLIKRFYIL